MLCLYSLWKSFSLSNSTYNIAFSFTSVANLFFRLLTSKFKFPIFKLIIAIVLNNFVALSICITFATTSSTNFSVLFYVVGFLDPSTEVLDSCINLLPDPNSNDYPSIDLNLLIGTYGSGGLNTTTRVCVPTFSICILVSYRPAYVCCYCCYKCCELSWLSI